MAMSFPKIRTGPANNRRDVKVSLQCAEQNLSKQKAILDADRRKRQIELERSSERMLTKSFGSLVGLRPGAITSSYNLKNLNNSSRDLASRGLHVPTSAAIGADGAGDNSLISPGPRRRITRRNSLNSGASTSQTTRAGPKCDPKGKSKRRGSVDANIPTSFPVINATTNPVTEGCQIDGNGNRRDIIERNANITFAAEESHIPESSNDKNNHGSHLRNAVFVFKYEDKNDKSLESQPLAEYEDKRKGRSVFDSDAAKDASRPLPSALVTRGRGGSPRKHFNVKIMTPVRELNSPRADEDVQGDSGVSEGSENSSCGTRSLYSGSNDSLLVGLSSSSSSSPWFYETAAHGQGRDSNKINLRNKSTSNTGTSSTGTGTRPSKSQLITDDVETIGDIISPSPRKPSQASLVRRRRSIAVVEDIDRYRQMTQAPGLDSSSIAAKQDSGLAGKPTDSAPSQNYLSKRRGSTSVLHESFGRDNGELRPVVGPPQDSAYPTVPRTGRPVRLSAEARRKLETAREREAAWENVRRSYYLQ